MRPSKVLSVVLACACLLSCVGIYAQEQTIPPRGGGGSGGGGFVTTNSPGAGLVLTADGLGHFYWAAGTNSAVTATNIALGVLTNTLWAGVDPGLFSASAVAYINSKSPFSTNVPAGYGLYGPASGAAAAPFFRFMVPADMATNIVFLSTNGVTIAMSVTNGVFTYTFSSTGIGALNGFGTNTSVNGYLNVSNSTATVLLFSISNSLVMINTNLLVTGPATFSGGINGGFTTAGINTNASNGTVGTSTSIPEAWITGLTTDLAAPVTLAKMANETANTILGNGTGSAAPPQALSVLPTANVPAFTGDVTTPGGSLATTIANSAVTLGKMANEPANTLLGNGTGSPAAPQALSILPTANVPAFTGDVTTPGGSLATTIAGGAVTLSKMANETGNTLLGNGTGSPAAPQALSTLPTANVPAFTGDVTTPGGSLATTISSGAVTLPKMANETANTLLGNATGSPAAPQALSILPTANVPAFTGDVTTPGGSLATTIASGAVTLPKMANETANTLLGNATGSAAAPQAIGLDGTLSFVGSQLHVPVNSIYVSPGGTGSGNGTVGKPYDIMTALSHVTAANAASTTILVGSGTYSNTDWDITTAMSGLTIRNYGPKWSSIVTCTNSSGIFGEVGVTNITIQGLQFANCFADGIHFASSTNWIVRDCWIRNSGNIPGGDGQGIYFQSGDGHLIERCLIENNGKTVGANDGIHAGGVNCVLRNNVIRYNVAYGIEIYSTPATNNNDWVYNNLVYGNRNGLSLYSTNSCTNFVYGNTIVNNTNYGVVLDGGNVYASNNIIFGGASGTLVNSSDTPVLESEDYNLMDVAFASPGTHDVITNNASFVNTNIGLFWLSANSAAIGKAVTSAAGPVDFFSNTQGPVGDIGAFQNSTLLSADLRIMDPSPSGGADYWRFPTIFSQAFLFSNDPTMTNEWEWFGTNGSRNAFIDQSGNSSFNAVGTLSNNRGALLNSNVSTGTWSFTNTDAVNWLCYIMGGTTTGISQNDSAVSVTGNTNIDATLILQPNEWLRITNTTAPRFTFKRF